MKDKQAPIRSKEGAMKLCKIFALMAISSLSPGVRSNELPDMPTPKTESVEAYKVREQQKPVHRFYASKETRITLAVELLTWGADMGITCRNLSTPRGHEDGLPVQTCGRAILFTAGLHAAGEGVAYLLHRTGHHRLEQFPRYYFITTSAYGTSYSLLRRDEK